MKSDFCPTKQLFRLYLPKKISGLAANLFKKIHGTSNHWF